MTHPQPRSILDVARAYLNRGWQVIPVPAGSKVPLVPEWQRLRLTPADLPSRFQPTDNVGVILGEPSRDLVDVDLDCPEAIRLAPDYLPGTLTFGRRSKPRSHWLFTLPGAGSTKRYEDPITGKTIVELRAKGGQTVFPGSQHSNEPISWDDPWEDDPIPCADLAVRVAKLAAAILAERYGADMPPEVDAKIRQWLGEPAVIRPRVALPPRTPDILGRAAKYLSRIPGAVSGAGGHPQTFRAALALVKGFDLEPATALALLESDYNPRCDPPWSTRELEHKVNDASASAIQPGYLLVKPAEPPPASAPSFDPLAGLTERARNAQQLAFEPDVIRSAGALDPEGPVYQKLLADLKSIGVRLRDWQSAVKRARATRIAAERVTEVLDPADGTPASVASVLMRTDNGQPRKCVANLVDVFARDYRLAGRVGYHAMREALWITEPIEWGTIDAGARPSIGEWTQQDSIRAAVLASRDYKLDMGTDRATEAMTVVAHRRILHPLKDYLAEAEAQWDGCPRIDTWTSKYLGSADTDYTRAVGARWLISAVARVFDPGCKVDCVLILEGLQGIRKSTALNVLAGDEFFAELDCDLKNKDSVQVTFGKWILEIPELSAMTRGEVNTIKAWMSRRTDRIRPSYEPRARDLARQFVLAGTTNSIDYLKDETGNRRFWPIACVLCDIPSLRQDRDQIWAEAVVRYRAGAPWFVDTPELAAICAREVEQRQPVDPWVEPVSAWLADESRTAFGGFEDAVTVAEVLGLALKLEAGRWGRGEEMRCSGVLKALGWTRDAEQTWQPDGRRVRYYRRSRAEHRG